MAVMHWMHGGMYIRKKGIYIRRKEKEKRGESSYVLNEDINKKKPSYLIGNVSCFSKLKSRVQTRNCNFCPSIYLS